MTELVAAIITLNAADVTDLAQSRNSDKELYCTECCTTFRLQSDGYWRARHKTADVINKCLLKCTCGETLGFIAETTVIKGEVLGMN